MLLLYVFSVEVFSHPETAFIVLSTLINIILAVLIVFRLIFHQRHVRNVLGAEHGSLYTNVIIMCVESSALMVITSSAYPALASTGYSWIPFLLYPHICVRRLVLDDI